MTYIQSKFERDQERDLIKDTKKRTAQRHELHDSPWVWLAAPLLLLALLVVGWVRSVVGI